MADGNDNGIQLTYKGPVEHLDNLIPMLNPQQAQAAAGGLPAMPSAPPPPAAAPPALGRTTLGMVQPMPALEMGTPSMPGGPAPRTLLGKVGHGLGIAGEIAGTAFAPRLMPFIPGTEQHSMLEQQRQEARQEEQSLAAQRGAEASLQTAEAGAVPARAALEQAQTKGEEQTARLTGEHADMLHNAIDALKDPSTVGKFTDSLGKLDPNERAVVEAGFQEAQLTGSFAPLTGAVDKIYQQRQISGRLGPQNTFQDPNSPTGYSKMILSRDGQSYISVPTVPPAGMVGRENQTFRVTTDAYGNERLVPVTTVSTPLVGGQTARATAGGGAMAPVTAPGAGGAGTVIGHKPLSQAAKNQIGMIDTTLSTLDQLRQQIEPIEQQHQQGQLSDVAAKNALWLAYQHGFANSLSDLQANVSLDQILGSLAYMKGTRAFQWIQQIQQHLPKATDSYPLMLEKIRVAERTLPWLKYGTLVTEGVIPANADKLGFDRKSGGLVAHYKDGKVIPVPF